MIIKEIQTEAEWNSFVTRLPRVTFLHSWQWGRAQQRLGEEVQYLGFFDGHSQIGAALVITVKARRGHHYFVPHGPVFATEAEVRVGIALLVDYLRKQATRDKVVALRLAPLLLSTTDNSNALHQLGFRPAPLHAHAELTWVLPIEQAEDILLRGMRKTTRHAIKKAAAHNVNIEIISGVQGLPRFMSLYLQTSQRQQFVPFSQKTIQTQLEVFGEHQNAFTVMATHQGRDVAAAIIILFGSTAFYYHGASVDNPEVPATHFLQWAAICEAKRRMARVYNFWGIAPDNKPRHPFAGITLFKKGFGGYAIDYLHAQDLPLSLGYWKLWAVDSFRKWRRGF